jgi:hypothetical protein
MRHPLFWLKGHGEGDHHAGGPQAFTSAGLRPIAFEISVDRHGEVGGATGSQLALPVPRTMKFTAS